MAEKMTRRTFIKGAAAAAVAVSLSGVLAGCGGTDEPVYDEVQVGAFTVKVYDAEGYSQNKTDGTNVSELVAKVKLTYNSQGGGIVSYAYDGMFTGKVGDTALTTLKPTGTLAASNWIGLDKFMKETVTDLKLSFPDATSYGQFVDGKPVELTIKIDNAAATLYLVKSGAQIVVSYVKP